MRREAEIKRLKEMIKADDHQEIDKYFKEQAQFISAKTKFETINGFFDDFEFLNNEFESEVQYNGLFFPSAFNAFQSARTSKKYYIDKLQQNLSPEDLYDVCIQISDPLDWEERREGIMTRIVRDKFVRCLDLQKKLLETGHRDLVNIYSEKSASNLFWGKIGNQGTNKLGEILMKIRQDIKNEKIYEIWFDENTEISEDLYLRPEFTFTFYKSDKKIIDIRVPVREFITLSGEDHSELYLEELSNKFKLFFLWDSAKGFVVINMSHTSNILVNKITQKQFFPIELLKSSVIEFVSTDISLDFKIDFTKMKFHIDNLQRKLEKEERTLNESVKKIKHSSNTLVVKGFGDKITEEDIEEEFQRFGKLDKIVICKSNDSNSEKIAFVTFKFVDCLEKALRSHCVYLGKRRVTLDKVNDNKR